MKLVFDIIGLDWRGCWEENDEDSVFNHFYGLCVLKLMVPGSCWWLQKYVFKAFRIVAAWALDVYVFLNNGCKRRIECLLKTFMGIDFDFIFYKISHKNLFYLSPSLFHNSQPTSAGSAFHLSVLVHNFFQQNINLVVSYNWLTTNVDA